MKTIPNDYQELELISNKIKKNNNKTITFISSTEGLGTTTLAISMARRLSLKSQRVLLINLNTCNPTHENVYEDENLKWSFTDITCQLYPKKMEGFNFLSIKELKELELVKEKETFKMAIKMLMQEYDYILFDMSPLNKKNHSNFPLHLLLEETDIVILNIAFQKTTQEELDKSINKLIDSGCKDYEIVINQKYMKPLGFILLDKINKFFSKMPKIKNKLNEIIKNKKWLFNNV